MHKIIAISVLFLGFSAQSIAGTLGSLNWDGTSDFITSTETNTTWVQLAKSSGMTYAQALEATTTGGTYSGYHIANYDESRAFLNYAVLGSNPLDGQISSAAVTPFADGVLGQNWSSVLDLFFYTNDGIRFQTGELFNGSSTPPFIFLGVIQNNPSDFALDTVNTYTSLINPPGGFLFVSNVNTVAAVPEPTTTLMLGLGLLGLFTYSRRQKQV